MSHFCSKLCSRFSSQNKPHRFIEIASLSLPLWPVLPPFCASHSPVILWLLNRSFIISQVQLHFCTFAAAIPSAWKAFNLRYMYSLLIPCIQASAEICCMSILQCFSLFCFCYFHFMIYRLFLVLCLYKQCMSLSICENLPVQYLLKLYILRYSYIAQPWYMEWSNYAK